MFFVLPVRDEPSPPVRPVVTWALLAANVAVFLVFSLPLMYRGVDLSDPAVRAYLYEMSRHTDRSWRDLAEATSAYSLFLFEYGFRPAAPTFVTLFTSMFLHGGWAHLLGNMLFLWIFGDNVEHQLGRVRYLVAYLAMGAVATLVFALFANDSPVPMVGASGAISGVLGCYFLWFPRNRVKLLTVFIWIIQSTWVPARWVLGFYILVQNIVPFLLGGDSGVAYGAHIGGFLGGLGVAVLYERFPALFRRPRRVSAAPPRFTRDTPLAGFRRRMAEGSFDLALREYSLMSNQERGVLTAEEVFTVADALAERTAHDAALTILRRWVATHPNDPELAAAHLRLGLIQLHGLGRPTAAYQHLLTVLDLEPAWEVEEAARRALAEIVGSGGRPTFH
jgi:membrane associated rhomboid family serine protease